MAALFAPGFRAAIFPPDFFRVMICTTDKAKEGRLVVLLNVVSRICKQSFSFVPVCVRNDNSIHFHLSTFFRLPLPGKGISSKKNCCYGEDLN